MRKRNCWIPLFVTILLLATYEQAISQSGNERQEVAEEPVLSETGFGFFENDDMLRITLKFDITEFMKKKPDEEYLNALMIINITREDSIVNMVRLRARGNYRYRNCAMPPVRLNLKMSHFGYSDLDSITNIKLVTHCYNNDQYLNYILREYLIYKLYNIVSDYSFRVRFLQVHYIDTGRRGLNFYQYAFAIEPLKRLLYRTNSTEIEDIVVRFSDVDPDIMTRLAVFQYMIANSDWYLPLIHNYKVIKEFDVPNPLVIPVPYDFDYSGWVNTHYSIPREDLGIEEITDRIYMGPCRSREEFNVILAEFLSYREAFIEEVKNFKYLDAANRHELVKYIKDFYKSYKRDALLREFLNSCKQE